MTNAIGLIGKNSVNKTNIDRNTNTKQHKAHEKTGVHSEIQLLKLSFTV